jgi:hypothetical protein
VEDIENLAPAVSTINALGASPPGRLAIHPSHVIPGDVPGQIATTRCGGPDQTFEPVAVRYIKLGENGKWATNALEQGIIPFGYRMAQKSDNPTKEPAFQKTLKNLLSMKPKPHSEMKLGQAKKTKARKKRVSSKPKSV